MGGDGRVFAFASSPILLCSPQIVLIPKETHLSSDLHSGHIIICIYILFFFLNGAISYSFSSESLYLIVKGLSQCLYNYCLVSRLSIVPASTKFQLIPNLSAVFLPWQIYKIPIRSSISCPSNFATGVMLLCVLISEPEVPAHPNLRPCTDSPLRRLALLHPQVKLSSSAFLLLAGLVWRVSEAQSYPSALFHQV